MRSLMIPVLAAAMIVAAACGGSSSDRTTAASTAATTRAAKTGGAPPIQLLGNYTTTLTKADVGSNKAPELQGQYKWKVKVTKDGGVNNAPTLTVIKPPSEVLESSTLSVSGDTLTLTGEECAQPTGGYKIISSAYTWKLDGTTLRLTTAKPGCPDKVAETILTSEPWEKKS